jgi:acetyltransferase
MMERTKIYTALKGVRGWKSVDLDELEQILVRFSELIAEQRWIKELDINPLLASPDQLLALDARVLVYGPEVKEEELPTLALHPYPTQYVYDWTSKKGEPFTIRPIRPEDEPMMVTYHESISDQSVYLRYLHPMKLIDRVKHERLGRICHCDYDREMTMVAEGVNPTTKEPGIFGVARLSKIHGHKAARFTVLVVDSFQGHGIGSELLRRMIQIAHSEKLEQIVSILTSDNAAMKNIIEKQGFELMPDSDGKMIRAVLNL